MNMYYKVKFGKKELIFNTYEEIASYCLNNNIEVTEMYRLIVDTDTLNLKEVKII